MTYSEAQQYLESFIDHEIHLKQLLPSTFKLERTQQLLHSLGDPHKGLKVIHVAGSKGKGSICALTASILQSAGYTAGLYTSPHINTYRERIRVLRPESNPGISSHAEDIFSDCISEDGLCAVIGEIKPVIEEVRAREGLGILSFFEVYTALALYYFCQCKVDFVVLETGLGGRLDATNAVDSMIAAIAPISLEHTRILGDTITQITQEKAAIIKNSRQKVVIAPQTLEAKDVLRNRCRMFDIDPLWVDEYAQLDPMMQDIRQQVFDLKTSKAIYKNLTLSLAGKHQRDNAAVSVCIAECLQDLGFMIPMDAIRDGLKNVFWPGRLEAVAQEPLVLLDGAHNPASAQVLSQTIREIFGDRKIILILGTSEDKDKKSIYGELSGITKNIIFTKADHPRAADLAGAVSVKEALGLAYKAASPQDIVLITGSIFVISEARKYLLAGKESCIK